MNITPAQKIKTGLLVTVSILLLGFLIFIIGRNKKLFSKTFSVYANFKNIAGTREGNYVRFAGINVGTVDDITLVNDSVVQLRLNIDKYIQNHLRQDAIASIGTDGLMGDKLIILHPGNKSLAGVKEGDTLGTVSPVDADKILNSLSRISENADSITTGLSAMINKINNGDGLFGKLIGDDRFAKKIEGTLDQTSQTVSTLKKTASNVNENMEAAKHNFLLRGYFKKKERQRIRDSVANAKKTVPEEKDKN